ncbi:MAG: hypothetical protein HWD85_07685 [Flavobacteriaceae bacterium]|nr:hypothetical protein [Flavobacteriaceae bacterium]
MKNLKYFLISGFLIFCFSCKENYTHNKDVILPDSLSSNRILFSLSLKDSVANKYWPKFNQRKTEGAFIYFNDSISEVFFPDSLVLKKVKKANIYSNDYLSCKRTDTIPYHFELMISFDSVDKNKFYYKNPVLQFLNVEETNMYIPSVKSTEMWSTMVLHEMFHQFQFNHLSFKNYVEKEINTLDYDIRNLISIAQKDSSYFSMLKEENNLLLNAIHATKSSKIDLLKKCLKIRKRRLQKYTKLYPNIEKLEDFYILQEGSARYIEYKTMKVLNELANNNQKLTIKKDSLFKNYKEFKTIDLNSDELSYLITIDYSDYYYTLGFNLMRVLDSLNIDYKNNLFNHSTYSFHKILSTHTKIY